MSKIRVIAKNSLSLFSSQILSYILVLFYTISTASYLGAEDFGVLSLALSITGIFGIVADMGLNTLITRDLARDKLKTDKYVSNTVLMKILLSFLTFGLIFVIINLFGYSEPVKTVIYIMTLAVVINSFSGVFNAVIQANEKMEYISISQILTSALMLVGVLLGINYNLDLFYFAILYVISNSLIFFYILIVYFWKFSIPKIEIDFSFWKPTMNEAWAYGVTGLSGLLYTYADSILLSLMQGNLVVGFYSAAYRFTLVLLFIPNAVNSAIFPVMSKFYLTSKDSLNLVNERYFKYMVILGIPIGFGTTILADKIILLFFGPGYLESIIALKILIWTIVFTFAGASFVQLLLSINKQVLVTKISGICLLVNIILNLILIPNFSYIGASVVTVITEVILVSYIIAASFKLGYRINSLKVIHIISKVLIATLIMSGFLWYFHDLNLFLLVLVGTLLYFTILYLVRGFDKVDLDLLKKIVDN